MDLTLLYLIKGMISIGLVLFGIGLLLKFFFGSSTNNPFKTIKIFPKLPLEIDRKVRKKVLKRSFRPDLVPKNLDAIVIGSGIGGLTCAGLMARSGKRVLVLEQHDRAGGCTHTYKSKGCEFDVGIHYIGSMEEGSMNRCLIDLLTDKQLDWVEMDECFDTVVFDRPGETTKSFGFKKGIQQAKQQLLDAYPKEHEGIEKYFSLLKKCSSAITLFSALKILPKFLLNLLVFLKLDKLFFSDYHYLTQKSFKEILDGLTDDEELKGLLAYFFGDYGVVPRESCFMLHGLLFNHYFRKGAYYPVGGSSEIAYQIIPGIERSGGAVLTQAFVKEILMKNNKACGVRLAAFNGTEHTLHASVIISGAGIFNTYKSMIPASICDKYSLMDNMSYVKPGITCIQVMVGLNGTKEELDISPKNYWMYTHSDPGKEFEKYLSLSREEAVNSPIPVMFVSFPSAKDPTWNRRFPNKSTCIIVVLSKMEWFEEWRDGKIKKRGAVYDGLKTSFINQAWDQVVKRFPQLEDKVDNIEGGSPLSHVHYINSMHGELYGMHHNKERFHLRQAMNLRAETPIPNLYLTGQDIFTCGFMGGAFGGVITASKVLDRYLIFDWINSVKENRNKIKFAKKLD